MDIHGHPCFFLGAITKTESARGAFSRPKPGRFLASLWLLLVGNPSWLPFLVYSLVLLTRSPCWFFDLGDPFWLSGYPLCGFFYARNVRVSAKSWWSPRFCERHANDLRTACEWNVDFSTSIPTYVLTLKDTYQHLTTHHNLRPYLLQ